MYHPVEPYPSELILQGFFGKLKFCVLVGNKTGNLRVTSTALLKNLNW